MGAGKIMKKVLSTTLTKIENMVGGKLPAVTVLGYHSISNDKTIVDVTPENFKSQISFLKSKFQFITLDAVVDYITGKLKPEKPCVALTFDDGYADLLVNVAPMLVERRIPVTAFVLASPESANRKELEPMKPLLNLVQLKRLQNLGWTIGCHSATHSNFGDNVDTKTEITEAKKILERKFDFKIKYFAYPKGIYNEKVVKAVKSAGYKAAFTVDPGSVSTQNDIYKIPRIGVDRTHSMAEFASFFTNWANRYFATKPYFKRNPFIQKN